MARNGKIYDNEWNATALKFMPLNEKTPVSDFTDRWRKSKVGIIVTANWQYDRDGYQVKLVELMSAIEFIPPCDAVIVTGGYSLAQDGAEKFGLIRSFVDELLSGNPDSLVIYDENGVYEALYSMEYFRASGSGLPTRGLSTASIRGIIANPPFSPSHGTSPVYCGPYGLVPKGAATSAWSGNANRIRRKMMSHPFMGGGTTLRGDEEDAENTLVTILSMGRMNGKDMHVNFDIGDVLERIEFKPEPDALPEKAAKVRHEMERTIADASERTRESLVKMPEEVAPLVKEVDRKLNAMNDIMEMWEHALARVPFKLSITREASPSPAFASWFGMATRQPETEVPDYDIQATYAIGRALGMDQMIDAYLSGVPKEDIIA